MYAVFTGFGQPVQRALAMVLLYLAARAVFREKHALQAVGVAALCLLVWDPHALFDAGLQMTILTVVATGGIAVPLIERTFGPYLGASKRIGLIAIDHSLPPKVAQYRVMLRVFGERLAPLLPFRRSIRQATSALAKLSLVALRILELIAISATVEIVMALPMALYFHRATLLALPVNLLLIPMLGLLLPAAILTAAAALLAPHLAFVPAIGLAALLHLAVGIVHFFAGIQAGDLRVATPSTFVLACTVALMAMAVWAMRQRSRFAVVAVVALFACVLAVVLPHALRAKASTLELSALDVGQGDALLVITPTGRTMMVDCGGPTGGDFAQHGNFEIGEDVVSPALWTRGISRLDVVALSHAHSDNPPTHDYEGLLTEAHQLGITVRSFHTGDAFAYGGMDVRVLAPAADYQPEATAKNDDSLVLRLAFKKTSALLEGDAEAPSEAQMAGLPGIHSDLLKVGHHGSKTSTTAAFLSAVSPRYAVVSVGLHNLYHHPRFETLEHLEEAGVLTWRTDLDGMSTFYLDGEHITTAP
jgi:competence protein ComEC